jgi:hypothetical protein
MDQIALQLKERLGWGGARTGAGRKRTGRAGVAHRARPVHSRHHPVHTTLRLSRGLPSLRTKRLFSVVQRALALGSLREGFRLVHFSVQRNHVHLIVEADDARALGSGIKGFEIRVAHGVNKLLGRRGRVFADRYHSRPLRTPRETRHAIRYVVLNAAHHGHTRGIDPFSSARCFGIWRSASKVPLLPRHEVIVSWPKTWLLDRGWTRHGLLSIDEVPG